jgi:hypothetical protein
MIRALSDGGLISQGIGQPSLLDANAFSFTDAIGEMAADSLRLLRPAVLTGP